MQHQDVQPGMLVRLTGGPFPGHRGIMSGVLDGLAIIVIERSSGPARPCWDIQPVPTYSTHYVPIENIEPL